MKVYWPGPTDPVWVLEHPSDPLRWVLYGVEDRNLVERFAYPCRWIELEDLVDRLNDLIKERTVAAAMAAAFQEIRPGYFINPDSP